MLLPMSWLKWITRGMGPAMGGGLTTPLGIGGGLTIIHGMVGDCTCMFAILIYEEY